MISHIFECKQMVIKNEELSGLLIEVSEQVGKIDIIGIEIDTTMDIEGFYWAFVSYKERKTMFHLSRNDNNIEITMKTKLNKDN